MVEPRSDTKFQAFLADINRLAGGTSAQAPSQPASPPPSGTPSGSGSSGSGSSGSSSGGSGGSNSGSGNGSGGNSQPPTTGNGEMSDSPNSNSSKEAMKKMILGAMILVAIGSVLAGIIGLATSWKNTTPEGRAHSANYLRIENEEKERQHRKDMRKMDLRELELRAQRGEPLPPVAATPAIAPSATNCIAIPTTTSTTRRTPFSLKKGQCFMREQTKDDMWIVFNDAPTSLEGSATFRELVPTTKEDGTSGIQELSFCVLRESLDKCKSYLVEKKEVSLWFTNSDRVQINM